VSNKLFTNYFFQVIYFLLSSLSLDKQILHRIRFGYGKHLLYYLTSTGSYHVVITVEDSTTITEMGVEDFEFVYKLFDKFVATNEAGTEFLDFMVTRPSILCSDKLFYSIQRFDCVYLLKIIGRTVDYNVFCVPILPHEYSEFFKGIKTIRDMIKEREENDVVTLAID
jgi:hypothetical protein